MLNYSVISIVKVRLEVKLENLNHYCDYCQGIYDIKNMHVTTRAQLEYVCGLFPCVFVFPDNLLAVWQGSIPVFNFAHHVRECWTRDDIRCKTDPFFSCHKFLTKIRYFIFGITCCRSHLVTLQLQYRESSEQSQTRQQASRNSRNVFFGNSLRWPIHIINSVHKTKLSSCIPPKQHHGFFKTYHLYSFAGYCYSLTLVALQSKQCPFYWIACTSLLFKYRRVFNRKI